MYNLGLQTSVYRYIPKTMLMLCWWYFHIELKHSFSSCQILIIQEI